MHTARPRRHCWRWTRRSPATHEGGWRECLVLLGHEPVVHTRPGRKIIRLEVYHEKSAPLRTLQRVFGGRVEKIDVHRLAQHANAPRRPLPIAPDLAVIDAHGKWPASRPRPRILLRIAGAMAFGTGEHATTAACLRLLHAEAATLKPGWTALDIGTGSGILSIAGEKLGAARVDAFDYDPRAVKAAGANIRRNRCRRVRLAKRDLLRWRPKRRYPLVLANVFSEVLCQAAPQIIDAVASGGCILLSGILRDREKETLAAFLPRGLKLEKTTRRGKWVTLLLRAP